MGNRSSKTTNEDWSSDEDGGSDYEHNYKYHTTVLHHSPTDGFQSDDEEEDEDGRKNNSSNKLLPAVAATSPVSNPPAVNSTASPVSNAGDNCHVGNTASDPAVKVSDAGDSHKVGDTATADNGHRDNTGPVMDGAVFVVSRTTHESGVSGHKQGEAEHRTKEVRRQAQCDGRTDTVSVGGQGSVSAQCIMNVSAQRMVNVSAQRMVNGETQSVQTKVEAEEVYETAGEGMEGEGEESDNDSLSTITPPRTRRQSDSDRSMSLDSDSEEKEESTSAESDEVTVAEVIPPRSSKSTPARGQGPASRLRLSPRSTPLLSASRSPPTPQRQLPRRQGRSPDSYRHARKRAASPKQALPAKRSKPADGIDFSPDRNRYGVFESESESDTASRTTRRSQRMAVPPPPPPPRAVRGSGSLSARTLRQAAKRAASQFVETSRKMLQDARAAARILTESTSSKRRASFVADDGDTMSEAKRRSPAKRETRREAEGRREERLGQSSQGVLPARKDSHRRGAVKRRAEDAASTPGDDSDMVMDDIRGDGRSDSVSVRKDGGRFRKFTRNDTNPVVVLSRNFRHSPHLPPPSQPPNIRSNSLPLFSGAAATSPPSGSHHNTSFTGTAVNPCNTSFTGTAVNPFHNVTLVPTSSSHNHSRGSMDSISAELSPPSGMAPAVFSFFSNLAPSYTPTPSPVALSAGSVWSRINTRTRQPTATLASGQQETSPTPGTSSSGRMQTRYSPQTVPVTSVSPSYPARSTPRVPSLTLTGQFAQSGRFAFLLEDVLQVTVTTSSITMATTSAIVVIADTDLRHRGAVGESVAGAAGAGFTQACQDFLRRNKNGLQVCEVVDSPAGGHLSPLISHVLHVTVPETSVQSESDVRTHKKLLLCTYLNCLKHASEKLGLSSVAFPLIGSDSYSADECIQVFFDSVLVYLAERTSTCPLHAIHLTVNSPAVARFAAEVLEARRDSMMASGVDVAMATVFKDYFNIPDFTRTPSLAGNSAGGRSPSGKPAVKRRRL
ncbi:serine-rich adhesin for platelets-like [Littorina saxatilis]|uniref:serine-rich adhesin for platelets-like n=1 Tax=Littorina saxatilis TaxID=31220 RepID=UPI0038B54AD3